MNVLMQRSMRLPMLLTTLLLCGCAPEVLPPSSHSPSTPAQIRIYQKQPASYEALGAVSVLVTADMKWDENGDATPGFEALKAKAAAMGANGILLMRPANEYDVIATAGYKGVFFQVPMRLQPKTAIAEAIFVVKE